MLKPPKNYRKISERHKRCCHKCRFLNEIRGDMCFAHPEKYYGGKKILFTNWFFQCRRHLGPAFDNVLNAKHFVCDYFKREV